MIKKLNNKGISLIELIIAIAIMAILSGVLLPSVFNYVDKAKKVAVEKEASEFMRAAQLAFIEVNFEGKEPKSDVIKHKTVRTSPYFKNGTLYGNLTNWTVHNGVVATASNAPFAEKFFDLLGITIGKQWMSKGSPVPISTNQPKLNQAGSLTNECIFQIFYDKDNNMIIEYSRNGYFVRMENGLLNESVKIRNSSDKHFTSWQ